MNKNKKTLGIGVLISLICMSVGYATFTSESARLKRLDDTKDKIIEQRLAEAKQERAEIDQLNLEIEKLRQIKTAKLSNMHMLNYCAEIIYSTRGTFEELGLEGCGEFQGLHRPDELYYTHLLSDNCYVSQTEQNHYKKENGGMLATDVACGKQTTVYAPDLYGKPLMYTIESKQDPLLGDYVVLTSGRYRWILGHVTTGLKDGDTVFTGKDIGMQNLSGVTTGYHTHIELWMINDKDKWINISTTTRSTVLENKRSGKLDDTVKLGDPIYFTHYNLGNVGENDASPCNGASGVNLCKLSEKGIQSVAITVDVRNLYNIKLGDTIRLRSEDGKEYQVEVHDEKNIRFRTSCIQTKGVCNKGDIAYHNGKSINGITPGVYTIIK